MAKLRIASILLALIWIVAATSASARAETTVFRLQDLDLRDPHLYTLFFTSCTDFTDSNALFSVNDSLQDAILGDTNPADGYLDLSYVLEFEPLDQSLATNALEFGATQCTAPMAGTACTLSPTPTATTATLSDAQTCLEPVANTLYGYTPATASTPAPCFATAPTTLLLNLAGLPVALHDAQIAATFDANPATTLSNGLVRGFLSEADADATIIPPSYPAIGGQPLSSILPGGNGNCAAHSDKDVDGDTVGWWFYFNFPAARVVLEPIFADGFDG
jgi:hypothetical protein